VKAFDEGKRFADLFPNAHTMASGLRVPAAVGDFMMLDAIRESGGRAVAGKEESILGWMREAASQEGISLCPESAVCLEVLLGLVCSGWVRRDEKVVVFNTGAAQKYPEVVRLELPRIDKDKPVDYGRLGEGS
jgi:threonine synthase